MKLGILDLLQPAFGLDLFVANVPATGLSLLPNAPAQIVGTLPSAIRDFLSFLSVEELQTYFDDQAVVYSGKVQLAGAGNAAANPQYRTPSGNLIEPGDFSFQFRITYPRVGSASLSGNIAAKVGGLTGSAATDFTDMQITINLLGATGTAAGSIPSDYPTKNFRIELLFNTLILHLPNDTFWPARLAADGWLERDPTFQEVTINLPKIAMSITQNGDDFGTTSVSFDGWGTNSLDDPNDLLSGELISMKPALCLHSSNVVGFGMEKIVLDLSADFTPPEIIEKNFGIGDDFKGLWMPQVRLFIAPSGLRGMAFDTWGKDLLIDFDKGLSGEIGIELVNNTNRAPLDVQVLFFEGTVRKTTNRIARRNAGGTDIPDEDPATHNTTRTSFIATYQNADIQLRIQGGRAPYTISVKRDGTSITGQPTGGDANRLHYPLSGQQGSNTVMVNVQDVNGKFWNETITVTCSNGAIMGSTRQQTTAAAPQITIGTATPGYTLSLAPAQTDNDAVFIQANPNTANTVLVGTQTISRLANGTYRIPVIRNGTHVSTTAQFTAPTPAAVPFNPDTSIKPFVQNPPEWGTYLRTVEYAVNPGGTFSRTANSFDFPSTSTNLDNQAQIYFDDTSYTQSIRDFLSRRNGRSITIYGYASYEGTDGQAGYNMQLSHRRSDVLKRLMEKIQPGISSSITIVDKGDVVDHNIDTSNAPRDDDYQVAIAVYNTQQGAASPSVTAEVWRAADTTTTIPSPCNPAPAPTPPERPGAFRRIGAKVRFQRNELVLAEIWGEFDLIDEAQRNGNIIQQADNQNGSGTGGIGTALTTTPQASATEDQGILDFRISMVYDKATRRLTQTLAVGFDRNNVKDGFAQLKSFSPEPLANTLASLMLFAPLIQGGIEAIQNANTPQQRTTAVAVAAAEIGVATLLGLFAIKMDKITLFDAELSFTELSPDIWVGHAEKLAEVGILFDYAVDFKVNFNLFNLLTIRTKDNDPATGKRLMPPRARYKAIGFALNFEDATRKVVYKPIFDTSKGYELSLGDPGALEVLVAGQSLNNLLRIQSARMSRENPLTFEADLAINVNLGIISVDFLRVRLRIYNEQSPVKVVPEIGAVKVGVNIPGALTGKGYLDFGNSSSSGTVPGASGGFQGYVDVSLVPIKLRIAASVGIKTINKDGREATAFFLGLQVELPAGIPLGATGLGIFGFLGLFGMHYERKEEPQVEGQLPPALKWFYETVHGDVIDIQGWQPQLDKWSFGLGVILGTMEGGFVLNLKGMFILELPGPRILILVKASILFPKPPDVETSGKQQSVGILAVIDLDFNIGRLTIGLVLEYQIESVLSLRVPIVSQFSFGQPQKWFIDIGSNVNPASAQILGIVRGYAYLMIHGDGIPNWPTAGQQILYGFSIALGIGASVVFGDKSSGLYLELGVDVKAGVGFAPFHFYGEMDARGQLNLWIVSISAWANLKIEGPDPQTYIYGQACGKVSFLFFDVKGCVDIEINSKPTLKPPPDLLTSLTLVSRSSALLAGQGVDRPIDGALGKAAVKAATGIAATVDPIDPNTLLTVPIDSIPVINLFGSPLVAGCTSFTDAIGTSPLQNGADGWINVGGDNEVHYRLKSITLSDTLLDNTLPKPVNWWKKPAGDDNNKNAGIDLALLCWTPDATPRAIQRSNELTQSVIDRWKYICEKVAPPTTVLYTFNKKPLGYNEQGWKLNGIMWPDPPGTTRKTTPDTNIFVWENRLPINAPNMQEAWMKIRKSILDHAKVIGLPSDKQGLRTGRVLQLPFEMAIEVRDSNIDVSASVAETIKKFEAEQIFIDCGELEAAEIFLSFPAELVQPKTILFRTFDKDFNVLKEAKAEDYGYTIINSFTNLPLSWQQSGGPWLDDTSKVWTLLGIMGKQQKLQHILVHYKGIEKMRYIEIVVTHSSRLREAPSLLLDAIETLTAEEWRREQFEEHIKTEEKNAVESGLGGERLRPLLKPATQYELTVNYEYQQKADGNLAQPAFLPASKTFVFKTDAAAPQRIDPWILATTPQGDAMYHFIDEPVQVFLNDLSVIQLFKVYGINLSAKVMKANGAHPPQNPAQMALNATNLQPVTAAITTPWIDTVQQVVNDPTGASQLPCINTSGQTESHQVFTVNVPLLKSTEYSLEVQKEGAVINPNDTSFRTPMFKVAFRTSRFANAAEMAGQVKTAYVKTKVLTAHLADLATECTDNEMEKALNDAGLPSAKPGDGTDVTLLWSIISSGGSAVSTLEAILINTPEPAWRKRPYPTMETVQSESGPMKQWTTIPKYEMEWLEAADTSIVKKIAHTQGGGRTIIYLKPAAPGQRLHLQLKRHKFTVSEPQYNTATFFTLYDLFDGLLPAVAPWDTED